MRFSILSKRSFLARGNRNNLFYSTHEVEMAGRPSVDTSRNCAPSPLGVDIWQVLLIEVEVHSRITIEYYYRVLDFKQLCYIIPNLVSKSVKITMCAACIEWLPRRVWNGWGCITRSLYISHFITDLPWEYLPYKIFQYYVEHMADDIVFISSTYICVVLTQIK